MRAAIAWMADNHVAANILMFALLLGGLFSAGFIKQEIFPDIELDLIEISVSYFGAGPEDIEEGVLLQVEDAIRGIGGIKEIRSTARENVGTVMVEVDPEYDTDLVLQDIKNAVDRIVTFPEAAERPVIRKLLRRRQVLYLAVYGDASEHSLRYWAERIRDELLSKEEISQVDLSGVRPYEITVSVPEDVLRRYQVTLEDIARLIRESAQDIPAGRIRTEGGQIRIRTKAKKYWARQFDKITVVTRDFGLLNLGDIVKVEDSFRETDVAARFDGKPAAMLDIYRTGDERPTEISRVVRQFVSEFSPRLPSTIKLAIWKDRSEMLRERINLLVRNALMGLVLVLVVLGLFLQLRLAFWVMLGMPVSFLGAMAVMPALDVSINMISLFAFIMALGIVVDDAIVVGENIFEHRKRGKSPLEASVDGALQVARPVVFSVLTSILAFVPLLFIEGSTGKFIGVIPKIVISILAISLFESLFILPAHLNTPYRPDSQTAGPMRAAAAARRWVARRLEHFIKKRYRPALVWLLENRYLTIAAAMGLLIVMAGLVGGGIIKFRFMPKIEADTVKVTLKMVPGTTMEQTSRAVGYLEEQAMKTIEHFKERDPGLFRHIYTMVGAGGANQARISLILAPAEERRVSSSEVARYWRRSLGPIPGVEYLEFKNDLVRMGENIHIRLAAKDFHVLEAAGDRIRQALSRYPGVSDITFDLERGEREIQLRLRPEARALGLTAWKLGQQVRSAFYGAEALRFMRGENEVWVMVKYPNEARRHIYDLYNMRVATPDGSRIPITKAADITETESFSAINRVDRKRVINITASVDEKRANAREVLADLKAGVLSDLEREHPGIKIDFEGESRASSETLGSMKQGFMAALAVMYILLAVPFRSYSLPFVVMCAIPFGVVGAVLGHMLLGYNLSIMSLFGMVALSGVVINDSLLLLDYVRIVKSRGLKGIEAVAAASTRRFRPILLTSLTTFFGLAPMLMETSIQARFLVPMAISLAFGILFATVVTLVLIPAIYLAFEDLSG